MGLASHAEASVGPSGLGRVRVGCSSQAVGESRRSSTACAAGGVGHEQSCPGPPQTAAGCSSWSCGSTGNPLNDLADTFGVSSLGYVVDFGATASSFACVTGSLNAASRLLRPYGLNGMAHGSVGQVHAVHRTPTLGIRLLCVLCGVVVGTMLLAGVSPIDVFAILGTIGFFGYRLATSH